MPFLALNAVEDDIRQNEEKHTLEFQFEDALKLFEKALGLQKNNDSSAKALFLELLKFPLFDLERFKNVPPSTFRLKSLALKNYSVLLLDELKQIEDPGDAAQSLHIIINQLLDALELSNDPAIVEILCSLADHLGYPKIARVALEELVSNSTNRALSAGEACLSENSRMLISPKDEDMLARLRNIVSKVGDSSNIPNYRIHPGFNRDLSWIQKFRFNNTLVSLLDSLLAESMTVSIPKRDIGVLLSTVEQGLTSAVKKRKKDLGDTYLYSERPINVVNFVAPHGDAINVAHNPSESDTDIEEVAQSPQTDQVLQTQPSPADIIVSDIPQELEPVITETSKASTPVAGDVALRQSARNRVGEFSLSADFGQADRVFINHINSYLSLVNVQYQNVMPAYEDNSDPELQYQNDFKVCLEKWDSDQAQIFLSSGTPEMDVSQPVMQMLDFAAIKHTQTIAHNELERNDLVEEILEKVQSNSHVQRVRFQLLCSVLCSSGSAPPLICTTELGDAIMVLVGKLIDAFAPDILSMCRVGSEDPRTPELAEALYEYYLDRYLTNEREARKKLQMTQKKTQVSKKRVNNELLTEKLQLKENVERWKGVASDILGKLRNQALGLRFQWVSIFYHQAEGDDPEESISKFQAFQDLIKLSDPSLVLEFANYHPIPTASVEGSSTEISKFGAASIFTKVFAPSNSPDDVKECIGLLEPMLMPETYPMSSIPQAESISQFLKSSSIDFKLNLWFLLLGNYEKIGETQKSLDGLIRILKSAIDELLSDAFCSKDFVERSYLILQTLNVVNDVTLRLLPLVRDNEKLLLDMDKKYAQRNLECIVRLCELLHMFTLTDQAINSNYIKAPHHQTWESAVKKLREIDIRCWCLFYYFYRSALPAEKCTSDILNDTLSIIHEHLGTLGYCGYADGMLLKLNINEILRLDWPESEADLLQCLNCRYGISLASDSFTPYNHHAVAVELTRSDALKLTRFIMRMVLNKKNLSQVIQRQSVRQVLDSFQNAIGSPDTSISQIALNEVILSNFIDSKATLPVIRQCLRGDYTLSLAQSHDPTFSLIGNGGFYYVMALVHLNQYRIKKRTTPEKTDDLHDAIKFFKYDLTYGTNRFESWMGLSQAHELLAETSLIFSSPELQNSDHFAVEFLRQAILCGCMATSVARHSRASAALSPDYFKNLKSLLYSHVGKMFYYSAVEPLSMDVYNLDPVKRFVYADEKYEEKTALADRGAILKIALHFLKLALLDRPDDWFSLDLMAEVSRELDQSPQEVMGALIKSNHICAANVPTREIKGALDATFEPIQLIVSFAWSYYNHGKLSSEEVVNYLRETGYPFDSPENLEPALVYKAIMQVLYGLTSADKKHWLHYPRYILAKIYDAKLNDSIKAQQEMEMLISVKSPSRPLVQIWKPDYERPGQHFDFCRNYVIYYTDLLVKNKEDATLGLLARKARKFQALSDHIKVWNHVLSSAVGLAKDLIAFPKRFTERVVPALIPEEFEKRSEELEKWVQEQSNNSIETINPWILALDYAQDLKKLNIGLGSTVAVDELTISVYMGMYELFKPMPRTTSIEEESITPSAEKATTAVATRTDNGPKITTPFGDKEKTEKKKIRINRKDILQKASQVLKPVGSKLYSKTDVKSIPKALYGKGEELNASKDKEDEKEPIMVPMEVILPPIANNT